MMEPIKIRLPSPMGTTEPPDEEEKETLVGGISDMGKVPSEPVEQPERPKVRITFPADMESPAGIERQESESWGDIGKDVLWDLLLFGGATAVAAKVGLPLAAGIGIYGVAKYAEEKIRGKPEETLTESLVGKEFPPELRALTHAGEAGALIKGAPIAARIVGGATGKALHGLEQVTSKPLAAASDKYWSPIAEWLMDNIVVPPFQKIRVGSGAKFSSGIPRSLQELGQPAIDRLPEAQAKVIREAELNKGKLKAVSDVLTEDVAGMSLWDRYLLSRGFIDRKSLDRAEKVAKQTRWLLPERGPAVDESFTKVKDAVEKFHSAKIAQSIDAPVEVAFDKQLAKVLSKKIPYDVKGLEILLDPTKANIMRGRFTKEAAKAIDEIVSDIALPEETKAFFRGLSTFAAQFPRDVFESTKKTSKQYMIEKFITTKGLVSFVPKEGYERSTTFGLRGMKTYIPRDLELQLRDMQKIEQLANRFGAKFMSMWKSGKTIWRPAYYGRNSISSPIIMDWGGLPWYRMDIYGKGARMIWKGDGKWKEFKNNTALGTFVEHDAMIFSETMKGANNMLDVGWKLFRRMSKHPARLQNAMENWYKFSKYLHNIEEMGMTKAEAILDAQKFGINYAEASLLAGHLRSGIYAPMPFGTWYSKILPLFVESSVRHPLRVGKWLMFGMGLQNFALSQTGISDEEWESIKNNMPTWMSRGINILLPWRDSQKRLNLYNATFVSPGIGDVVELWNLLNFTSAGGLQVPNPAISLISALQSQTKSSGAPLYYDWEPASIKYSKVANYALEQLMPAITPGFGTDWRMVLRAMEEQEGAPTAEQAALSFLGFKMRPIEPHVLARKHQALKRIHEQEWGSELRRQLRSATSAKEREETIRKFAQMKQGINED